MHKKRNIILISSCTIIFLLLTFLSQETTSPPPNTQAAIEAISGTYTNPRQHFSFQYGSQYQVRELINRNESGIVEDETVIIEPRDTRGAGDGVQVAITPFSEGDAILTKERIQRDIPDMHMGDARTIVLGGVDAISFLSNNSDFGGANKEVWLGHNNFLFQISAYVSSTALLNNILTTWKFQ